jgi:large subunit ribosomal protein L10
MVSEVKKEFVQKLISKVKGSTVVAVVNLKSLPAQQLQNMRAMLRQKDVEIIMARKKLLDMALKQSGNKDIEQLAKEVKGMPALLFSSENPFTLCAIIQKNKSEAPAKAGQTAPKDIMVKAGATSFAPGPIISELAAVGIKTKVENGKLTIVDDVIVAKEGAEITAKIAENLKRLDIKPMEVGLDLVAAWENGTVFTAKQLYIDEEEYLQNVTNAAQWAFNLAVECGILTAETTEVLLQKAFRDAKSLALEQNFLTEETKEEILAKAEAQANSVKEVGKIEVGAVKESKEEPKVEEKEEEPKEKETKEE